MTQLDRKSWVRCGLTERWWHLELPVQIENNSQLKTHDPKHELHHLFTKKHQKRLELCSAPSSVSISMESASPRLSSHLSAGRTLLPSYSDSTLFSLWSVAANSVFLFGLLHCWTLNKEVCTASSESCDKKINPISLIKLNKQTGLLLLSGMHNSSAKMSL